MIFVRHRAGAGESLSSNTYFKDKKPVVENDKYMVLQALAISVFFASLIGLLLTLKYRSQLALAELESVKMLSESQLPNGAKKYTAKVSYELGLLNLQDNPAFRDEVKATIARSEYPAVYFEMPPVTLATKAATGFEFVVYPAPSLEGVSTDFRSFSAHLSAARPEGCEATTFKNLGGDATLVVPCHRKTSLPAVYAHLSAFVRGAPSDQVDGWWAKLASTALETLSLDDRGERPLWVSTSGDGISYLHGRLDSVPKYYNHKPYKEMGVVEGGQREEKEKK